MSESYLASLLRRDHRFPCLYEGRTVPIDGDLRSGGVVGEQFIASREGNGPVNHYRAVSASVKQLFCERVSLTVKIDIIESQLRKKIGRAHV